MCAKSGKIPCAPSSLNTRVTIGLAIAPCETDGNASSRSAASISVADSVKYAGFEHRSELFDKNLGLHGIADDDLELPDGGIDALTDQVTVPGSLKIAQYEGAPSMLGGYVGFAPSD